jgi:TRAP-type C4-dicarboxylate transport system permease small subunit
VEIIASRFPDNVKVNLERLGYILGIVVFFLIVWQGTKMGIKYWHRNETTGILNLPKYIFRLMLPVGGTLGCLELILLLIRSFVAEDSLPDNAGKGK